MKYRFPDLEAYHLDLEAPEFDKDRVFEIVYCYGLLYHLKNPHVGIEFMASHCSDLLLLETCVSYGTEAALNPWREPAEAPTQSVSGQGCRPTRSWVFDELKKYFEYVCMPITQPNHEEFPLDWHNPAENNLLTRSVFIASRNQLHNSLLSSSIPMTQIRH